MKNPSFAESEGGFLCCRRRKIASQISLGFVHSVSLSKSGGQRRASVETEGETERDQQRGDKKKTTTLKTQLDKNQREKLFQRGNDQFEVLLKFFWPN